MNLLKNSELACTRVSIWSKGVITFESKVFICLCLDLSANKNHIYPRKKCIIDQIFTDLQGINILQNKTNWHYHLPFFCASGPPKVSEKVNPRQSVRLGRTAKLPCPVEGDPLPIMIWSKDGRNINGGWTRFKVLQHSLRIKEVETDDAGTYICRAINGFGSANINYTLIVIGR